jgi:hypothetical protein
MHRVSIIKLTCGRPALRLASSAAGTEAMGFFHMFGGARMPIWGVAAMLSNILLVWVKSSGVWKMATDIPIPIPPEATRQGALK